MAKAPVTKRLATTVKSRTESGAVTVLEAEPVAGSDEFLAVEAVPVPVVVARVPEAAARVLVPVPEVFSESEAAASLLDEDERVFEALAGGEVVEPPAGAATESEAEAGVWTDPEADLVGRTVPSVVAVRAPWLKSGFI